MQDGSAHKSVWHSRGDKASKFCILCLNLFDQESEMVDEDGTNLLCCNVLTWEQLVPASSKGLRKNARFLEKNATTMAPGPFIVLQQSLGLTYHKHALLLERRLGAYVDPVEVYMHD